MIRSPGLISALLAGAIMSAFWAYTIVNTLIRELGRTSPTSTWARSSSWASFQASPSVWPSRSGEISPRPGRPTTRKIIPYLPCPGHHFVRTYENVSLHRRSDPGRRGGASSPLGRRKLCHFRRGRAWGAGSGSRRDLPKKVAPCADWKSPSEAEKRPQPLTSQPLSGLLSWRQLSNP